MSTKSPVILISNYDEKNESLCNHMIKNLKIRAINKVFYFILISFQMQEQSKISLNVMNQYKTYIVYNVLDNGNILTSVKVEGKYWKTNFYFDILYFWRLKSLAIRQPTNA